MFQTEAYKILGSDNTNINVYKTTSGNYYEITGFSSPITREREDIEAELSPAATAFYEACLNTPVYCDPADNGNGTCYIFCETISKLCIKIATLNINNNSFMLNCRLYVMDAQSIPQQLPSLGSPSYEFSGQGILSNPLIKDPTYTESNDGVCSFTNTSFNVKKSTVKRIQNSYNICTNNPITCTATVNLIVNPDTTTALPCDTKYSFTFPINSFTWDVSGNLVGVDTSYSESIGDLTAQISIVVNQLQESVSTSVAIIGPNSIGSPPTPTIIAGSVIVANQELPPLVDFNVSTYDDWEETGGTVGLAGWAAHSIFSAVNIDVSFSSIFPGIIT